MPQVPSLISRVQVWALLSSPHHSFLAAKIINEAEADLANYLDIPEDYEILFMQSGGSGEEKTADILQKQVATELKVDYSVTGS